MVRMADSDAVRSRRKRLHARGDHSECRRSCPEREQVIRPVPSYSSAQELDPAAEMRELAGRLVVAHRENPGNAMLARELRATLRELAGPEEEAGPLEFLRALGDRVP